MVSSGPDVSAQPCPTCSLPPRRPHRRALAALADHDLVLLSTVELPSPPHGYPNLDIEGHLCQGTIDEVGSDTAANARMAAVREVLEETGVLLPAAVLTLGANDYNLPEEVRGKEWQQSDNGVQRKLPDSCFVFE